MDIINYALSKKIKKYVDDISSSRGHLIVTLSKYDSDTYYATHSSTEIYEAFQNGKTVVFNNYGVLLQLVSFDDSIAIFSSTISSNGVTGNFTIRIDKNSIIDDSDFDSRLNPVPPQDSMILNSSTDGSTKQFQITVDDSGTITATEVQQK